MIWKDVAAPKGRTIRTNLEPVWQKIGTKARIAEQDS